MENFIAYNPVKLHFGKDVVNELGQAVLEYGKNVLLVYGKGSVVRNGYYDIVIKQLKAINATITEYSGIKPNPVTDDVDKATKLGIEKKVDVVVALGGGSVIDSAKIIAACISGGFKAWDVMRGKVKLTKTTPMICILTLPATATEMNPTSVLQDTASEVKDGFSHPVLYPKHSFLDPQFTFTLPVDQTANGISDLIAHSLENYFGDGNASLTDRFVESIIKEAFHFGPLVLKDPHNYEYRAAIMWAATCALNGTTSHGRIVGDWGVHGLGHQLSFLFDMAHGTSLSIVYPAWLKLHKNRIPKRIKQLGMQLFDNEDIDTTIKKLEDFYISINIPIRLSQAGIGKDKHAEIIRLMVKNNIQGVHNKFSVEDYATLVDLMK